MNASDANSSLLIIGVGNPWRRDDSAGLVVARRLQPLISKFARVIQHEGDGTHLLDLWENWLKVIIVDATRSGAYPGTVQRFDVSDTALPTGLFNRSSHSFGVPEAIALGRVIHRLPRQLIIYGIEGAVFEYGDTLSALVAAGVAAAVERIVAECAGCAA